MLAMSNVKGVARNEDLLNVVQLAKRAMPNRPDGVVVCAQNSSLQHIRNTLATVFTSSVPNAYLCYRCVCSTRR